MLSRSEVKQIPYMNWNLYKRICKHEYSIFYYNCHDPAKWSYQEAGYFLFRRDHLNFALVADKRDKLTQWSIFKPYNPGPNGRRRLIAVPTDHQRILDIFCKGDWYYPGELESTFQFHELVDCGLVYVGGKSERWFKNEFYHEQFMAGLETL